MHINEQYATEIPGLFAAGEGTAGIHGANRLSGNGLTMTQVWGKRAGEYASEYLQEVKHREPNCFYLFLSNRVMFILYGQSEWQVGAGMYNHPSRGYFD